MDFCASLQISEKLKVKELFALVLLLIFNHCFVLCFTVM
jgi:hypothetical protein